MGLLVLPGRADAPGTGDRRPHHSRNKRAAMHAQAQSLTSTPQIYVRKPMYTTPYVDPALLRRPRRPS